MPRLIFGFILLLLFPDLCISQQGIALNKTLQLFSDTYNSYNDKHHSIIADQYFNNGDTVKTKFHSSLKPVVSAGFLINDNGFPINTRIGGLSQTGYKNKLYSNIKLYYDLQKYPEFVKTKIDSLNTIPRYGIYFLNKKNTYSTLNVRGTVTWKPYQYLAFNIGYDKFFLGNGYRSLFLSDNAAAFPFFSTNLKIWKIHYISITGYLRDIYFDKQNAQSYRGKYITSHYLSYNITPSININLFESVVWRISDSSIYNGFNVQYLNPVIFLRPVEFSQGSTDNIILGFGMNYSLFNDLLFYSQLVLDEFYAKEAFKGSGYFTNKYGFQLGLKDFSAFNNHIKWLVEYNQARPFTYSHYTTLQNYGNQHDALAHPLGANFREILGLLAYTNNRIYVSCRYSFSQFGKDSLSSNFGNDIYKNYLDIDEYYGHEILQGIKVNRNNLVFKLGFIIKKEWNLTAETGLLWQYDVTKYNPVSYIFYFLGIKTLLYNDEWFD